MKRDNTAVQVLIASDVRLYRDGLAELLRRHSDVEVCGTLADLGAVLDRAAAQPVVIVLLDMARPDGIASLRALRSAAPRTRIIALTVGESDGTVIACAQAGVAGYVPSDGSPDDLVAVIRAVAHGEVVCPSRVLAALLRQVAALGTEQGGPSGSRLTSRETEIVSLMRRGLSNKEIARSLGVEVATVKNHVHHILEKLNVRRRTDLAPAARGDSLREAGPAERPDDLDPVQHPRVG